MAIFLKYGSITGSATDDKHKEWILIDGMSFGVHRNLLSVVGGAANRQASAPDVSDITLTKASMDKSSSAIFAEALIGKGEKAQIHLTRMVGKQMESYLEYTLQDTMIAAYQISGGGEAVPSENLTLSFTKIEMKHLPDKLDGTLDSPLTASYDLATTKKA